MEKEIYKRRSPSFQWIDVENPSRDELEAIAHRYGLHETSVQDCLEPEHLPKYEKIGTTIFLILRAFDTNASHQEDTVQGLTRKIALFFSDEICITVHRRELSFLSELTKTFKHDDSVKEGILLNLLVEIVGRAIETYERPIDTIEMRLDVLENSLFGAEYSEATLREIHLIRRRVTILKRMLGHTLNVIQRIHPSSHGDAPHFQDLKETAERLFLFTDELLDEVTSLMNIQITLASHRTNEVVRILTLFSVIFMPLTFVVGVYGMNFKHMPELESPYGYSAIWALMICIGIGIVFWFKKNGWLKR